MAESDGVLSDGTELHLTNSSAVLTKVLGLIGVNRPDLSIGKTESTDQDSNKVKEWIPGHGEVGELVATLKYEPGSPTDLLLNEHLASREKRAFKIVTPEEDGTTQDHTGTLFLMTYRRNETPPGAMRTATLTGQPGPITQAASA